MKLQNLSCLKITNAKFGLLSTFFLLSSCEFKSITAATLRSPKSSLETPNQKRRYIVTMKEGRPHSKISQKLSTAPRRRFDKLNVYVQDLDEKEVNLLRKDRDNVLAVEPDGPMNINAFKVKNEKISNRTKSAFNKRNFGGGSIANGGGELASTPVIPPLNGLIRMGITDFPLARLNSFEDEMPIDVAVIDSGIDPHEDLNISHFFSPFTNDGSDELGHGTAVAGIIGARDNGLGVVGVAAGVRLWNIKIVSPTENAWSHFLGGLDYVYQNAAQIEVVNISYGNDGNGAPILAIRGMIRRLVRAGVVVVAAAGNNARDLAGPDLVYGTGDDALPASLPEAMAVSAIDTTFETGTEIHKDRFWHEEPNFGSNYSQIPQPLPTDNPDPTVIYPVSQGGGIDVAAPGVRIPTTGSGKDPDGIARGYALGIGTSYATPHVAGLVALYILANGRAYDEKGVYKIRQAIIDESERLQPQSEWAAANPGDPDTNFEAMAVKSEAWVPQPNITNLQYVRGASGSLHAIPAPGGDSIHMSLTSNTAESPCGTDLRPCTMPGYQYTIQKTKDFNTWVDVGTLIGNGLPLDFIDNNLDPQMGFYRYKLGAAPPPSTETTEDN